MWSNFRPLRTYFWPSTNQNLAWVSAIVETRNYTELGSQLPRIFQLHPDKWIKLLFKSAVFQCLFGFIALSVWVLTWMSSLRDLFDDDLDPQVHHNHKLYFGLSVAMCAFSFVVGLFTAALHLKARYTKGVGFGIVALDAILVTWFATVYYHATKFYQEKVQKFSRAITGAEAATVVAGVFVLLAFFLEFVCAVMPAPPPPSPPDTDDPATRKIDNDQIDSALIELQK